MTRTWIKVEFRQRITRATVTVNMDGLEMRTATSRAHWPLSILTPAQIADCVVRCACEALGSAARPRHLALTSMIDSEGVELVTMRRGRKAWVGRPLEVGAFA